MIRYLYILIGLLFVGVGFIGIAIPGLPTTPFLLISAFFFVKSSDKLYNWLINHKTFGKTISQYREHRIISLRIKVLSISLMLIMVSISCIWMIESNYVKILVSVLGAIGGIYVLSHKSK